MIFSKGVDPSLWSKNCHFSKLFLLGNTGQENAFYDILEREKGFLGYKKKKLKKSKNWHFSKGVNPWFWSKNGHISKLFLLGNTSQENVFYDTLERKNAFLGYKKKKLKKSKNWHFSKEVNQSFWYKNGHFSKLFFLRQYRQGKCLSLYSRTNKAFLGYKKKKLKKSKNWHFSKGVNPWFWSKNGHFSKFFFKAI